MYYRKKITQFFKKYIIIVNLYKLTARHKPLLSLPYSLSQDVNKCPTHQQSSPKFRPVSKSPFQQKPSAPPLVSAESDRTSPTLPSRTGTSFCTRPRVAAAVLALRNWSSFSRRGGLMISGGLVGPGRGEGFTLMFTFRKLLY